MTWVGCGQHNRHDLLPVLLVAQWRRTRRLNSRLQDLQPSDSLPGIPGETGWMIVFPGRTINNHAQI